MTKKVNLEDERPPELTVTTEQQQDLDKMLEESHKEIKEYWAEDRTAMFYVPVEGGELRIIHVKQPNPKNKRTILFLPGWGVKHEGFNVLYEALYDEVDMYYLDSREKKSSKIEKRKELMSVSQSAKDIQQVIDYLQLNKNDFLLIGTCWTSTTILTGLIEKTIKEKNILLFDPMHKLWFSKFLLNISPVIPVFVVKIIKPILKFFALLGMKEKHQRKRTEDFIDSADLWKWKHAAYKAKDLELYGTLGEIDQEILVFNSSTDKIHDQRNYPNLTKEMPKGRFFYTNTDESNRERMMSLTIREFAKIDSKTKIPKQFLEFEKELKREVKNKQEK
ncbi:MAG: hypothetical protein FK734_13530 [Asgard group archaeon]|nr:hypothetical protein [Asgard group archaeon]